MNERTADVAVRLGSIMGKLQDLWKRISRNKLSRAGLLMVFLSVTATLLGPFLVSHDPYDMSVLDCYSAPSLAHALGTDGYGRDLLSRILYGGRISLLVGFSVMCFTATIGTPLGLLAGYYPNMDAPIMRIMDALMAFPAILLALALMTALGPSLSNTVIALGIVYTPRVARTVRASVLSVKSVEFVEAARAQGATDLRILLRHILPNCLSPLVVQETFIFAYAILAEASLSFVGAGVPPPAPSWGNILSDGRVCMREAPWITVFPGLAVALTVLGLNLLGDGVRDSLDPRMKM
jgi:peptide/nickel transport system permease protein